MKRFGGVVALMLALAMNAAAVDVSGNLVTQTWTKANSPYYVTDSLYLSPGAKLTIEPGVSVIFRADVPLNVAGRITAVGTPGDSIHFAADTGLTSWKGIHITGSDTSRFAYVRLTGAFANWTQQRGALNAAGTSIVDIRHSVIEKNRAERWGGGIAIENLVRATIRSTIVRGNETVLNGGGGIYLAGSSISTLDSVTVVGNTAANDGGGIFLDGHAVATLADCIIADNISNDDGGGIYANTGAQATLVRCSITGNWTKDQGGGFKLTNATTTSIRQSTIASNYAKNEGAAGFLNGSAALALDSCSVVNSTSDDDGGAFYLLGRAALTARGGMIARNTSAKSGGAVHATDTTTVHLTDTRVTGNRSAIDGGAFYAVGIATVTFASTLADANAVAIVDSNHAVGNGGAFYVGGSAAATIRRAVIAADSALSGGAIFFAESGGVTIENAVIAKNVASTSGGAMFGAADALVAAKVRSAIIRGNVPDAFAGTPYDARFSIIEGGFPGAENIDADPLFVDEANGDYRLTSASPAIDAGDPAGATDSDGTRPDIGIWYFAHTGTIVRSPITTQVWMKARGLYQVFDDVVVPAGETLTIEPGVEVQFDGDARLGVAGTLAAVGTEADSIRFLRNPANADGEYWLGIAFDGAAAGTIGYARISDAEPADSAGAIDVRGTAHVAVAHSVIAGTRVGPVAGSVRIGGSAVATWETSGIRGNAAIDASGVAGILAADSAQVTLTDAEVTDNAGNASGIVAVAVNASATLTRTVVARNAGTAFVTAGNLTVDRATVTGNDAVADVSGSLAARNSIFWANADSVLTGGGAIDVAYSVVEGGHAGAGNIDADPQFADAVAYTITDGSPAVDAGDPSDPADPDGTRPDIGARIWSHTGTIVRSPLATETWRKAYSPYRVGAVGAHLTVPTGQTLTIEPGVDVRVEMAGRVRIHGRLVAIGTETDSVRFLGADGPWDGILIDGVDSSALSYVRIGSAGLGGDPLSLAGKARVAVNNSVFRINRPEAGSAISAADSVFATFDACDIGGPWAESSGVGISVGNDARLVFTGCRISGFRNGVALFSIWGSNASVVLRRTLVAGNQRITATEISSGLFDVSGALELDHATIADNAFGSGDTTGHGLFSLNGGSLTARNSIVWSNVPASIVGTGTVDVAWSIFEGDTVIAGDGNLNSDPLFADTLAYALLPGSPAIDAGDPALPREPDGTYVDMGWKSTSGATPLAPVVTATISRDYVAADEPANLTIANRGRVDATVAGLTMPAGFATAAAFPVTLLPGDSTVATISYGGPDVTGDILVNVTGIDPASVAVTGLSGTVVADGNVSGVWTKASSPYRIRANVTVPSGETLTIEPGVDVLFDAGAFLDVAGALDAVGTDTDSILFVSDSGVSLGEKWVGIGFSGAGTGTIRYARISDVRAIEGAIDARETSQIAVAHSVIEGSRVGPSAGSVRVRDNAVATLDTCAIRDNTAPDENGVAGVRVEDGARATLTACVITDNVGSTEGIVQTSSTEPVTLARSVVARNAGLAFRVFGSLVLNRSTVTGNERVALVLGSFAAENSIIHGNTLPTIWTTWDYGSDTGTVSVRYSIVAGDTVIAGPGNLNADPLFADSLTYALLPGSPAVDAGDPALPREPDGTYVDMGYLSTAGAPLAPVVVATISRNWVAANEPADLTIANPGRVDATIAGLTMPSGFATAATFPVVLLPKDSVIVAITFAGADVSGAIGVNVTGIDPVSVAVSGITGTAVSGAVSGTWMAANGPYRVRADIAVPKDSALAIEPGVDVLFEKDAALVVEGRIIAIGTESDSIRFVPSGSDPWGGLVLTGGDSSAFAYVRIDGSDAANGAVVIAGSARAGFRHAIIADNAGGGGIAGGDSAVAAFDSSIVRGNDGGVWARNTSRLVFAGCEIVDNMSAQVGGVVVDSGATVIVVRSVIARNASTYGGGFTVHGTLELENVTVVENTSGVPAREGALAVLGGTLRARNTLFWDNVHAEDGAAIGRLVEVPGVVDLAYSLTDVDPLFVDAPNGNYHLTAASPAIDKGDPAGPQDPDTTRADIGAFYFPGGNPVAITETRPLVFSLAQNAPNPFNPETVIRYTLAHPGDARLAVYSVTGQLVRTLVDGKLAAGRYEMRWDGRDAGGRQVASGIYVYRLTSGEGIAVRRMALVR